MSDIEEILNKLIKQNGQIISNTKVTYYHKEYDKLIFSNGEIALMDYDDGVMLTFKSRAAV